MFFSFKYLKKLASLPLKTNIDQVVEAFNNLGFEVENVSEFDNKLKNLKFGKVLEVYKNPQDKNLTVAKVLFSDKTRTIQTRADNVFQNMFIVASIPGSLVNGQKIESKKLKGIISEGMFLSFEELGVSKEFIRNDLKDKIIPFEKADLKLDPIEFLDLKDYIIEIDILSNRADACSYLIMAKELAAYFNTKPKKLKTKNHTFISKIKVSKTNSKNLVCLETKNDFTINPFEQILLAKSHIKSLDNVNDLANLVFIHSGQPVYFFSKSKIKDNLKASLIASKFDKNTKDLALFSTQNFLSFIGDFDNLEKNIAKNEEVVFVLGQFKHFQVRSMNKKLKTFDKRSIQLGKRISLGTLLLAIDYLTSVLKTFSKPINVEKSPIQKIAYDFSSLKKLVALDLKNNKSLLKKLETLGFVFQAKQVEIPFYRYDLETEQDIDEEVLRIYGYDKIEPIKNNIQFSKVDETQNINEKIVALNFNEVNTYTLISKEKNVVNPFNLKNDFSLKTFVSNERRIVRKSQAISLLEIIENHLKQKIDKLSIFSEGMISNQQKTYCLASSEKTFEQMKQIAINLLPEGITFQRFSSSAKSVIQSVSAKIMFKNKTIGWIGKVNPLLFNKEFFGKVWILEFFKQKTNWAFSKTKYDFIPLKKRDITIELKENEDLSSKWKEVNLFKVEIIDVFYKDKVKKVTLRVTGNEEEIAFIDKKFN